MRGARGLSGDSWLSGGLADLHAGDLKASLAESLRETLRPGTTSYTWGQIDDHRNDARVGFDGEGPAGELPRAELYVGDAAPPVPSPREASYGVQHLRRRQRGYTRRMRPECLRPCCWQRLREHPEEWIAPGGSRLIARRRQRTAARLLATVMLEFGALEWRLHRAVSRANQTLTPIGRSTTRQRRGTNLPTGLQTEGESDRFLL